MSRTTALNDRWNSYKQSTMTMCLLLLFCTCTFSSSFFSYGTEQSCSITDIKESSSGRSYKVRKWTTAFCYSGNEWRCGHMFEKVISYSGTKCMQSGWFQTLNVCVWVCVFNPGLNNTGKGFFGAITNRCVVWSYAFGNIYPARNPQMFSWAMQRGQLLRESHVIRRNLDPGRGLIVKLYS